MARPVGESQPPPGLVKGQGRALGGARASLSLKRNCWLQCGAAGGVEEEGVRSQMGLREQEGGQAGLGGRSPGRRLRLGSGAAG